MDVVLPRKGTHIGPRPGSLYYKLTTGNQEGAPYPTSRTVLRMV